MLASKKRKIKNKNNNFLLFENKFFLKFIFFIYLLVLSARLELALPPKGQGF